jgi:hypothetical protein
MRIDLRGRYRDANNSHSMIPKVHGLALNIGDIIGRAIGEHYHSTYVTWSAGVRFAWRKMQQMRGYEFKSARVRRWGSGGARHWEDAGLNLFEIRKGFEIKQQLGISTGQNSGDPIVHDAFDKWLSERANFAWKTG